MEGRILFIELEGCNFKQINSEAFIKDILKSIAKKCQLTVIKTISNKFKPHGISTISMVSESHIALHSWPEKKYLSILIYTCGKKDPIISLPLIKKSFTHKSIRIKKIY